MKMLRTLCVLALFPHLSGNRALALEVVASDFTQKTIYHSPETLGHTSWCSMWRSKDGALRVAFSQVVGPIEEPTKRKSSTVILGSDDEAATWKPLREIAQGTAMDPGISSPMPTEPAFCGHGMVALPDGTLVTGLYPLGGAKSGYVKRSTDEGQTWSEPIYLAEPEKYKAFPSQIRQLRDGRLVLFAALHDHADTRKWGTMHKAMFTSRDGGKSWGEPLWMMPESVGVCEESDFVELDDGNLLFVHRTEHYNAAGDEYSGSTRVQNLVHKKHDGWQVGHFSAPPMPHSGFPELLKTREGVVLHIATDGIWWTTDAGANWQQLALRGSPNVVSATPSPAFPPYAGAVLGSPYYPRATQLNDGTILVIGHNGSDDVYGKVDEAIVHLSARSDASAACELSCYRERTLEYSGDSIMIRHVAMATLAAGFCANFARAAEVPAVTAAPSITLPPAFAKPRPVTMAELAQAKFDGVSVTEVSDYAFAGYKGDYPSPPHVWWRSEDGRVHDYASVVAATYAVEYGLLDDSQAGALMDALWKKIDAVGYKRFDIGLPCNLVSVPPDEQCNPGGLNDDGKSDPFEHYCNGGVFPQMAINAMTALWRVGQNERADRMFHAMLKRQDEGVFPNGGGFQCGITDKMGTGPEIYDWNGATTGYEGHCVRDCSFVMGVFLRDPAMRAKAYRPALAKVGDSSLRSE